jgi:outer membrane biosynthesis protein TonB
MVARIGTDGTVRDATHVAAPRDSVPSGALIDASLAAVRQWTYTPALLNGRPVDVQMAVTFTYQPRE